MAGNKTAKFRLSFYRLSSPFRLDSATGQLRLAEALDREAKENYALRVRADDGLQHTDVTLTIEVSFLPLLSRIAIFRARIICTKEIIRACRWR